MLPPTDRSSIENFSKIISDNAVEQEMRTLLKDLEEDLQLEKLPKKIKDFPKTIYHIEPSAIFINSAV